MMEQKRVVIASILLFLPLTAFAVHGNTYLGVLGGATFGNINKSNPQITYDNNLLNDSYPINNHNSTTVVTGVYTGFEFANPSPYPAVALGIGGYFTPNHYTFKGQVIETLAGHPSTTLYNYQYYVKSTRLMFEVRLTWLTDSVSPFIDAGVGSAWNKFSNYTETPATSGGVVALLPFQSRTTTNFAYQVGLGFSGAFNFQNINDDHKYERFSVGYRFVNLGMLSTGTRGSDYPYNLGLGRLLSNEVYLSYTHLF